MIAGTSRRALRKRLILLFVATLTLGLLPAAAWSQTLRVLVTNDDGFNAAGIDALVTALALNPNLAVTVVAPAANSSGTGEQKSTTTIQSEAATTLSGFPATKVFGFPADAALFGILQQMQATPPDLLVSGINFGQNFTGDVIPLSGTVGAAQWAARVGIPAIAVSASLTSPNFPAAAAYTASVVEKFRTSNGFRKRMREKSAPFHGVVLNINYPTCTTGAIVRGARVVAVGRATTVDGYTLQSSMSGVDTWQVTVGSGDFLSSNCNSTADDPVTDIEAWNDGFVAISPMVADRSVAGWRLQQYRFLQKLF